MTEKDILKKLSSEINSLKPNVIKKVIRKCIKEEKITLNNKLWKFAIGGLSVFMLCTFGGLFYYNNSLKGTTTIEMDVNPSIELVLNNKQKVVKLNALNNDAKKIMDNMDFKGSDYKIAVNALIGSMLKNGYITDLNNSILLSVNSNDDNIENELMAYVNTVLTDNKIDGAIVGQSIKNDDNINKLAQKYNISIGKATLIKQIIEKDKSLSWDQLAKLNINDLNLLESKTITKLSNIKTVGNPSDKSYIGENKAKSIALNHLGISESQSKLIVTDLDSENGIMVYEVDFTYNGFEYDYEINAKSGAIIKNTKEINDDIKEEQEDKLKDEADKQKDKLEEYRDKLEKQEEAIGSYIDKTKAKTVALSHANIASASILEINVTFDKENGTPFYEVDFETKEVAYDYQVNALTGKIIKYIHTPQDPVEPEENN